jgi:hypothetical protein
MSNAFILAWIRSSLERNVIGIPKMEPPTGRLRSLLTDSKAQVAVQRYSTLFFTKENGQTGRTLRAEQLGPNGDSSRDRK